MRLDSTQVYSPSGISMSEIHYQLNLYALLALIQL